MEERAARMAGLLSGAAIALLASGCSAPPTTDSARTLVCPQLAGSVDPLELSYASTPGADAQLRAFVAAARGLDDVTVEMQRLAVDACQRMRRDLGAPDVSPGEPLARQCEPVRTAIARVARSGVEIRMSIAPPRCEPATTRRGRCNAASSAAGGAETKVLCDAQEAIYAQCSLPAVTIAATSAGADVLALARTLEENLPRLLYAEMALARRLLEHVQAIVAVSARLPGELKDADPPGVACAALAAEMTARSAPRVQALLDVSAAVVAGLDPVVHPPPSGAGR